MTQGGMSPLAAITAATATAADLLVVGLGAGGNPADHSVTGVPQWSPRERAERLDESAAIITGMLGADSFDYRGRYYAVSGGVRAPAPVQLPRPPLPARRTSGTPTAHCSRS